MNKILQHPMQLTRRWYGRLQCRMRQDGRVPHESRQFPTPLAQLAERLFYMQEVADSASAGSTWGP